MVAGHEACLGHVRSAFSLRSVRRWCAARRARNPRCHVALSCGSPRPDSTTARVAQPLWISLNSPSNLCRGRASFDCRCSFRRVVWWSHLLGGALLRRAAEAYAKCAVPCPRCRFNRAAGSSISRHDASPIESAVRARAGAVGLTEGSRRSQKVVLSPPLSRRRVRPAPPRFERASTRPPSGVNLTASITMPRHLLKRSGSPETFDVATEARDELDRLRPRGCTTSISAS